MQGARLTLAGGARDVGGVAQAAVAAEGADAVDALPVPAQVGQHLALVDVCAGREGGAVSAHPPKKAYLLSHQQEKCRSYSGTQLPTK